MLIAESSPVDAKMLREILVETGADVLVVHDAESALSEMKRFVPDMVLMDVFFPDMSGLEVSRRIRSSEGDGEWTLVMFVSASDYDSDFEAAMEAGADCYMTKPIRKRVVLSKVRALNRILKLKRGLDEKNSCLERLSSTDSLTGVSNRRRFDEALSTEWARCRR